MRQLLFRRRGVLPMVLQSERAECGMACLVMVAGFFGYKTDLNSLRASVSVSAHGATLSDMMAVAARLGLAARALRGDIADLRTIQLPAVMHWNLNHFVVLKAIRRNTMVIHDPAVGLRTYTFQEAGRHFTGIVLELAPGQDFQTGSNVRRSKMTDLFRTYPGFVSAITQLFVMSLLLQLLSIGSAFYMQMVIDESLMRSDRDLLDVLAIAFLMLSLVSVAVTWIRAQIQLYFSNQLGFQMAGNVLTHLMALPVSFFERRHVGDVVSRFGSVREIRRILTEDLITVVLDGLFALITLGVMFYFNATLAIVVLIFVAALVLLKILVIPHIQTLQEQQIVAEAKTSSNLMENMRAIEVLKFYCNEQRRIRGWRNLYAEQVNTQVNLSRFMIRLDAVFGVLTAVESILLVYLAAVMVLDNQLTLGMLTAFIALKGNFSSSARSLVDKLVQIRLVRLQLERVSDITCSEKESEQLALPVLCRSVQGRLNVDAVSYRYPGSHSSVVQQLSFAVEPGEILAICGPSGCGKSTLLKIAAGLIRPDDGCVKIDGTDIRVFGLREYRDLCGGVLQTDQLLSGSIADNIALNDDVVDHARMQEAARKAQIADFVNTLPMGYNSLIGDMGSMMSAGQRQRILLARAFYKQPAILILDEATANLDSTTEQAVLLELARSGAAIVMVTHRPEALKMAHRTLVIA